MKPTPYIPDEAPFSGEQKIWLEGFLAGLHAQKLAMGGAMDEENSSAGAARPLNILFGTQTGNAEALAEDAAAIARANGFLPRVEEMDAVDMAQMSAMENLIVVVSTYGEGEMPDNAAQFWEQLSAATAPRLENLNYGVLALGDTSYDQFCQAGKMVDTRLEQLGARRLLARIDCDIDYEEPAAAWLAQALPKATDDVIAKVVTGEELAATADAPAKAKWTRKKPYSAKMLENKVLSGPSSAKEIRHLSFDLGDSAIQYEAGDALGVMPLNAPDLVEAFLARLGVDFSTSVADEDQPLGELLTARYEIMTPSRNLIRFLAQTSGHEELRHIVEHGDKESLENFLWGKDALDLLNLNPKQEFDLDEVLALLKPLQHRAYSISSSPLAHPGEVHLTVAAVRWMNGDRPHRGVCSTFLADHVPEGISAKIFPSPNKAFRVPKDDSLPMIMVGPGTGIAPFRAFLEERRARGAKGENWLFFGDQHRESDFIYADELASMQSEGVLSRLELAFSRDQKEKIYVQHRMLENGKELFAMLQAGGHFYVCGDATRMAKDVDAALHTLVEEHGKLDEEGAATYIKQLKREKRYVRDVY